MSIKSVCKNQTITIGKKSTLKEAADLMQDEHVGSLIVVESLYGKKMPMGIITDRDIALAMGSSQTPQNILVDEIMEHKPITAKAEDGVYETIVKMRENGVKRLPVLNDDGSLYGIISADDLLGLMGEEINSLAKILEIQVRKEKGVRMFNQEPSLHS